MSQPTENILVVDRLVAGWEKRDVNAIVACLSDDATWHNIPYPPIVGQQAIGAAISRFLDDMTEVRFEIRHSGEISHDVVMNERVDIFRRRDGTEVRLPVTGIFELSGGRIRAWRDYFDRATMEAQ